MPTATPFNNLITFSRGSNATVTGSNGLIQWAANNNATFSEQFDNAAWVKNSSSIAANVTTSPDGTRTADTWTPTSNGNTGAVRLLGTFTIPVGPNATTSIYVKSAGKRWVYLTTPAALSPLHNCWFDLQTGAVGTMGSGVLAATMTAVGDGWYRISTTSATTLATNYVFLSATDADNSTTVVADGTGVHIWGAQLELGSTATTYNPTTVKNLLGFSEAFDNAAWPKTNTSIVTGAAANPINGLFNAQKLMENTAAATQHYTRQNPITVSSAAVVTLSVYAKAGERRYIALLEGYSNKGRYFDLQTGTVGNILVGAPTASSITPVGSGWYRCSITTTAPATTVDHEIYLSADGASISYTGDGNSGVYIYGAQLSDSASLDAYVPTPGAAPSSTAFYGPRFDFDPVTLQPRGLLVEEQRTNLVLRSEEFDNASWTKTGATVTANSAVAPDGATTADTLTSSATSDFVSQIFTFTGDGSKSISLFLRAGTSGTTFFQIRDTTAATTRGSATITWTAGVPSAVAGSGGTIEGVENFGNGWYRVKLVCAGVVAANTNQFRLQPDSVAGTGSVIAWGAQAENGAFATSYIPTVASTVTRSADVAEITGSNFAQWYNSTQGTLLAQSTDAGPNTAALFGLGTNIMRVGGGRGQVFVAGSNDANLGGALTGIVKHALGYATNDMAFSANGGAVAVDTSCLVPSGINQLRLNSGVGTYANGHIRSVSFIPARAADFQLQALST